MKKIIAIAICATLLVSVLAGCKKDGGDATENPVTAEEINPEESMPTTGNAGESGGAGEGGNPAENGSEGENGNAGGIDFDAAYSAYPPDTIMMIAGDYTVTWEELFVQLFSNVNAVLASTSGVIPDWYGILGDGMTYKELVLNYSSDYALIFKAIEYGAKLSDVSLSQEDLDFLQDNLDQTIAAQGSEEELRRLLREENGCYSMEVFEYLRRTSYLVNLIYDKLYGEQGELVSDDDAAENTAQGGYLMAKHILLLKPQEGEDTAKDEIEDILKQLDDYNGDEFNIFFSELMFELSEDTGGLQSYPKGYLFQYGDMVMSFFEACYALDIGEYSGIVESEYGYHIIYRLPIDYDTIPYANYAQYDFTTLRAQAASVMFDSMLLEWIAGMDVEYTDEYNSIDFAAIFK